MLAEIRARLLRLAPLLCGLALVLAPGAGAQEREVVSKQIAVGRSEASLRLEFDSGDPFELSFQNGAVRLNGTVLGSYGPDLDSAWRALLSEAVTLENGPLAQTLRAWTPPSDLEAGSREVAARVDQLLESGLGAEGTLTLPEEPAARERRALAALLLRRERLTDLADAVEGLPANGEVHLHVAESAEVGAGEELIGTLVVVDGEMVIRGSVRGDVVVVGGRVRLEPEGRVSGDVRVLDGTVEREGGTVTGDVIEVREQERSSSDEREDRIREEVRREMAAEARDASFSDRLFSPVRSVVRGVMGVVSSLLTIAVLSLLGGVVLHFGQGHLEVVAETARRAPARAGAVGLAGLFLALPVWLLGAVALVISIIGIPLAILWLPLFPVALALAAVLGYYAVARNVGTWLARRELPYLGWVRSSHPATVVAGGVFALMAAFVAANVLAIAGPWLGFLRGLFIAGGVLITVGAALVGLGAVLITRGGRRPEYYATMDFFEERVSDDLGGGPEGAVP